MKYKPIGWVVVLKIGSKIGGWEWEHLLYTFASTKAGAILKLPNPESYKLFARKRRIKCVRVYMEVK